jgi:hypothetical protein
MRTLFGTLLGAIAVGVLVIAYSLVSPRMSTAADPYQSARPGFAGDRMGLDDWARPAGVSRLQLRCEAGQRAVVRQVAGAAAAECRDDDSAPPRASFTDPIVDVHQVRVSAEYVNPRRATRARVVRSSRRDWVQTAMTIGGASAAGAGIGGLFDGKRGALVGAAIGGGAGTLFEAAKR